MNSAPAPTTDDIAARITALAPLIERADAEASRLRRQRVAAWREARAAGLSWRAIAALSGVDHAVVAKAVGASRGLD